MLCFISIGIFTITPSYANNVYRSSSTHFLHHKALKEKYFKIREEENKENITALPNYQDSIDSVQKELIICVDNYMRKYHPTTKLSAANIVNLCIEYDYDIPLLLSQARQESCFGKKTRGNSVFGVVSRTYSHVNNSVEDYIILMKTKYVNKRTPEQCIASGFYVEGSKKYKYAGSPTYAKTIANHRTNIIKTTPIQELHNQIREYQIERDSMLI